MQTTGRNVVGSWGSLMTLNHLYDASLKTKFNNTLWPDLDCLISIHDENFLFFGEVPKCPHDFTVKCAMALGVCIQYFTEYPESKEKLYKNSRQQDTTLHSCRLCGQDIGTQLL